MRARAWSAIVLATVFAAGLVPRSARAATVVLGASQDNTLYEFAAEDPPLSNGSGDFVFAGRTGLGTLRRAPIAFDLGGIPPGSTVTAVSLSLSLSQSISGQQPVSLHRLTASWGEGSYGTTSGAIQRPPSASACLPQSIRSCP